MNNEMLNQQLAIFVGVLFVYLAASLLGVDSTVGQALLVPFFGLFGGGGAGGGCSNASTPFLYTWNGQKFCMDNDVMFGVPTSVFNTLPEGKETYEQRGIIPDLYAIQNKVTLQDGLIKIQIKEIEPETSAYDFAAIEAVPVGRDEQVVVDHVFTQVAVLKRAAVAAALNNVHDLTRCDAGSRQVEVVNHLPARGSERALTFGRGDTIAFKVKVDRATPSGRTYVLLDTWFRDWMVGDLYWGVEGTEQAVPSHLWHKRALAVPAALAVAAMGYMGLTIKNESTLNISTPVAHADVPGSGGGSGFTHSFKVHYWNGAVFKQAAIVSPRYKQPYLTMIALPEDAAVENGCVQLKVEATKRHLLTGVGALTIRDEDLLRGEKRAVAPLVRAFSAKDGRDVTNVLASPHDRKYVETAPGDVYELHFAPPVGSLENVQLLLRFGGVYATMSTQAQRAVGNWIPGLDAEARAFLKEVYDLKV